MTKVQTRKQKIINEYEIPIVGLKGQVTVEFPEGLWDVPVIVGVGRRVPNPNYNVSSTQRYAWQGQPFLKRSPKLRNGEYIVRMTKEVFRVKQVQRLLENQEVETAYIAERIAS